MRITAETIYKVEIFMATKYLKEHLIEFLATKPQVIKYWEERGWSMFYVTSGEEAKSIMMEFEAIYIYNTVKNNDQS